MSVFATMTFAQDVIIKRDATRIEATIMEVSSSEVRYKDFTNQSGPTFVLSTDEISTILYKNGNVQVFEKKVDTPQQNGNTSNLNGNGRLIFVGGNFFLGDKMMPEQEGRYFLMKNCMQAYQQYKMFTDLGYSGVSFMGIGAALILSGGIVYAVTDRYDGFCTMMAGVASTGFGIPLCAAGFACRGKACDIYNYRCANTAYNRRKGVTLDLKSSRDGIGLALRF